MINKEKGTVSLQFPRQNSMLKTSVIQGIQYPCRTGREQAISLTTWHSIYKLVVSRYSRATYGD